LNCSVVAGDDVDISDSDDEDVHTGHGSSAVAETKKQKAKRTPNRRALAAVTEEAPTQLAMVYTNNWAVDAGGAPAGGYSTWPWMQAQHMQAAPMPWMMPWGGGSLPSQMPWMMSTGAGGMQYLGVLWPPNAHAEPGPGRADNTESSARAARRQKRKLNDDVAAERSSSGRKPRQIMVGPGGEVDGACPGKNAWDDAIRGLVPRILDISVVDWEGQKPEAVQKLRDKLDAEFEYVGNPLSMQGFRNSVKRYLKSERSRLKMRYRSGDTTNPVHVQPAQWERLQHYWGTEKQVQKSAKMVDARSKVKRVSVVGRKGKAMQQALAVSGRVPINFQQLLKFMHGC
jgi:hypothetical protein